MVRGIEVPITVREYVKTLEPIEDLSSLIEGQKIFNKESLDISFVDTFISYDEERDILEYKNSTGEVWCGRGKGYWYYMPGSK